MPLRRPALALTLLYLDCSQISEQKGLRSKNDLSSPSKRESIHFPEYFLATGHRFANTRSPHRVVSTRATMRGEMWSARRLLFSSPSSSGLDKKRSHFPLKINKTAAQSEHAHNSKLGMWRGYSPSPPPELLSRRKTLFLSLKSWKFKFSPNKRE